MHVEAGNQKKMDTPAVIKMESVSEDEDVMKSVTDYDAGLMSAVSSSWSSASGSAVERQFGDSAVHHRLGPQEGSFCVRCAHLFTHYNAKIVVAEIMTATRTSECFLYSQKIEFSPGYVTIGTWISGGMVLRLDSTVGPWDLQHTSMARQGELWYAPGNVGDSIGASIVPAAKMLVKMLRMFEATGGKQLGKVVEIGRANFLGHLSMQYQGDLAVWGVGCMVYCNLAAFRPMQLQARFLPLVTSDNVKYD
jgi:hypothetical protein